MLCQRRVRELAVWKEHKAKVSFVLVPGSHARAPADAGQTTSHIPVIWTFCGGGPVDRSEGYSWNEHVKGIPLKDQELLGAHAIYQLQYSYTVLASSAGHVIHHAHKAI